jgi:type II secretory pathway pseudopilin PulG
MKAQVIQSMKEQRGIVLIVAMLVMAILSVLALAFLSTASREDTIAVNYRNHTQAFYAAEAGLEAGVANLKALLKTSPTPTDVQLTGLLAPALTDPSYTFDAFQVQRVRTVQPYNYQTTLTSGAYAGLNALTTDYRITATVTGPRGSRGRLTQTVQYLQIPLFQFGAFYGRGVDLEFAPGPEMTFNGRIHSNSNLHLISGKSLRIDSFVTTTGDIHRYRKSEPYDWKEKVEIKDAGGTYRELNFDHEYDYDFGDTWSEAEWKSAALSTFGGKVLDSAMGVQEIIPPIPDVLYDPTKPDVSSHLMIEKGVAGDSPALKDAKIYYQADLIIDGDKAYDQAGNIVDVDKCKGPKGTKAVDKTKFYDGREKMDMEVTQIDVGLLTSCGLMPKNGILYATAREGSPKKPDGIRLVNGAELPSQGLTVVSENPVYVQGDYNTVNKVPAAIMGDAVTVLSNNWGPNDSDTKGKDKVKDRPATPTTVNAAIATGPSAESAKGNGNGELNNLPRFLEYWKDQAFTYNGSLVALWHSQQVTGQWRCCAEERTDGSPDDTQYYQPPKRNWGYDTLFDTQIPPGTPMGIVTLRGQWSEG